MISNLKIHKKQKVSPEDRFHGKPHPLNIIHAYFQMYEYTTSRYIQKNSP